VILLSVYKKTYDEILDKLLVIAQDGIPDFTNYSDKDPLVILLKLIASMSVSTNKYSNKYLNSKFIQHASLVDSKSMYLLLEEFDKLPKSVIPGTIDVTFEYIDNIIKDQLIIPEGTKFLVNNIPFTILTPYYLKSYNSYINIRIIEGTYKVENFTGISIQDKRLRLNSKLVAQDYVRVVVDDEEYEVSEHAEYKNKSKIFNVEYDMFGNYNIVFSNNYSESINDGSSIYVYYIESTGTTDYDATGSTIIVSSPVMYNNENVSKNFKMNVVYGHSSGDTNFTERYNYDKLSELVSTFDSAITTDDYESLTNFFTGVAISAAYDVNSILHDDPKINIFAPFLLKIVVAPYVNYYLTSKEKSDLLSYLRRVGLSEEELTIELLDPTYVTIDITVGVNATTDRQSDLLNIYSTITNLITEYFKVGNIKFGSYISSDYISTMISKSDPAINYAETINFLGYQLAADELPVLGKLDVLFQYSSFPVHDEATVSDEINLLEVTYKLNDNSSFVSDNTNNGTEHRVSDNSTSINELVKRSFDTEFNASINQKFKLIESDRVNTTRNYSTYALSSVYTHYHNTSGTDDTESLDDTVRTENNAIVTDRVTPYVDTYNF